MRKGLVIFLLFYLIVGCSVKKNVLNVDNRGEPKTLDPAKVHTVVEFNIIYQIFQGLLSYSPHNLTPQPAVAEKYEISDDGLLYTFYLRKDAKWSDGTKIDANTFKDSWFRVINPGFDSPYTFHFTRYIKGAKEYNEGKVSENEVGIKVLDDYTLQIELISPTPYFLSFMAFPTFLPVPMHIIRKYGENGWANGKKIVSNGAFVVEDWIKKDKIILIKNENYYEKNKVKLDKVIFHCIEDDKLAFKMYQEGKLDYLDSIPVDEIEKVINQKQTRYFPYLSVYYYRFNVTKPPFDDINVRKAFFYAIDREYIVKNITKMGEIPAYGVVPDGFVDYQAIKVPNEDRELLVKRYLEKSKYKDLSKIKGVKLLFNKSNENMSVANYVKSIIKKKLNLDLEFDECERAIYFEKSEKLDFSIARSKWIGDYVDPNTFLEIFSSKSNLALTGWKNDRFDKLLFDASRTKDSIERMKILREAEDLLIQEAPCVPLYFYVKMYLVKPYVKGIYDNVLGIHPYKEVYLKND